MSLFIRKYNISINSVYNLTIFLKLLILAQIFCVLKGSCITLSGNLCQYKKYKLYEQYLLNI